MNFHLIIIDHSILSLHQASLTFLSLPQTCEELMFGDNHICVCWGCAADSEPFPTQQSHPEHKDLVLLFVSPMEEQHWNCSRAVTAGECTTKSSTPSLMLSFTKVALIFHLIAKVPTTPGCLCLPCY